MYTNFMVCESLKPNERCFYIRRYSEGIYTEICHEHVPKSRMSQEDTLSALKALIVKHSGWADIYTLQSYMNNRGRNPSASGSLNIRIEYPSPGVIRRICANSNIEGWVDEPLKVNNGKR